MWKSLFGRKEKTSVGGNAELIMISRKVDAPPERAFEVFVDRLGDWWPRDYTWGGDSLETIAIEANINGRCYERASDGSESVWGTVLTVDRPNHIVIAWQIKPDRTPEPSEGTASRVDVRFVSDESGATDVVVVHRDFPRHGDGWQSYKDNMAAKNGWPRLIDLYAKAVSG
jgi:uncharacterized protein YndB with AHSA1/START domain